MKVSVTVLGVDFEHDEIHENVADLNELVELLRRTFTDATSIMLQIHL